VGADAARGFKVHSTGVNGYLELARAFRSDEESKGASMGNADYVHRDYLPQWQWFASITVNHASKQAQAQ